MTKFTIPKTMNAVLLTGHGGPEMLEYRGDVPVPQPAEGEVLIEVHACGMNNTDIWVREGAYGSDDDPTALSSWRRNGNTLSFPRIQGADIVGIIVAVGKGVPESRVGERVVVDFSIYNDEGDSLADIDYIGHGRDGGYADYTALPSENAHAVATPLTDAEFATFCCAYMTGEHMLNRAHVVQGETVLITGASGGVGSGLVQLCRARGAIPIAVVSKGKEGALREIGAAAVVTRGAGNLREAVNAAVDGRAIDVVADLVAGPMFVDLLNILKPEGRYVTAGAIAGPVVTLDLRTMYLKHLDLIGCSQGTRKAFADVLNYALNGTIKPLVAETYPLSEIHRAQQDFKKKQFVGKLVMIPDRFYHAN
ncbi:MAG: alcohol dehydrogenase family protein [Gammaproteobacteria bacterium]|nr:alcohol dehydrogenase family protein [Gammaproteobacteria bacterium]